MLDKKIWLAHPGIELGPPEDTKTIRYLSIKIKTKSPGNFVTPTADSDEGGILPLFLFFKQLTGQCFQI